MLSVVALVHKDIATDSEWIRLVEHNSEVLFSAILKLSLSLDVCHYLELAIARSRAIA